jgi:hypothetical protein
MHVQPDPRQLQERERRQVQAAILLVADGRYREVVIAGLPDARLIAMGLVPDARRQGSDITLPANLCGSGCDVVVRRR